MMAIDFEAFAASLDAYLARITPFGFSGGLLVGSGERIVLRKGYGLADRDRGLANTPKTVFCLGSITKQFTAAAVMKLFELGRLDPDDPAGKYIAGVPRDKSGITLHHLLTHTSGLLNYTGGDYEPADREHVLEVLLDAPLQLEPGSRYSYSNGGYSLLAAIVEIAAQQPYEQFLYEQLLEPAGMQHTGYVRPDWRGMRIARWYRGDKDNGHALEKSYPSWNVIGNGEMLSTLEDMWRWHRALLVGSVLGKAAQARMYTPFLHDYAYGWRIGSTDLGTLIEHNGASDLGSSALFRRYVDAGLTLVLFCNRSYGDTPMVLPLEGKIEQILSRGPVELPPEMEAPATETLEALEGGYTLPAGGVLGVRRSWDGLVLSATGQEAINALAFPDEPPRAHRHLNETTLTAFSAALEGDFEPLAAFMDNAEKRLPGVRAMVRQILDAARGEFGTLTGLDLVGTLPSSFFEGGLDTLLQMQFKRGAAGLVSITKGGRNLGVAALDVEAGFSLPAVSGVDGLVGYHIPLGRVIRLDVLVGKDGRPSGLRVPGGEVAKRVWNAQPGFTWGG